MENDRRFLLERFSRLLECAEQDQENVRRLVAKLDSQISTHDDKSRRLLQEVSSAVACNVDNALRKSTSALMEDLKGARGAANEAARCYEMSANWAIWKVVVTGLLLSSVFLFLLLVLFRWYFPSPDELRRMMKVRDQLEANLDFLEESGALAKVTRCTDKAGDRLCVRVDSDMKRFGTESSGTYFIIDGY